MKKLTLYLILLLLFTGSYLYSQKTVSKDNFTFQVQKEEGDLNNDKIDDRIVLEMDLEDETRPLRLQIFLSQPDKKLKRVVSSTKIIESQYPVDKKGEHNGNTIPDFFIEEGVLKMLTDINDRKSSYEFRLKQNNFELVKISRVLWDGKETTSETEIDLIKGTKIEYDRDFSPNKKNIRNTKLKPIKALPKIQDLSFSDLEKL
ncbi:hypothetical protein BA768_01520 [Chryseobacterium sp. CBo1]|uniref:hypothetical protein n=1 Tax=Chryseobacterium sp. CBo1 TaxID=1869230 RepID=UPI000810E7B9|nr:hypothetical protein [Chryseobacterium sp. CBo1]OCK53260.1 hypothetical protein BA768_01520 [Chryseobacterium sp. CBo1]